VKCSFFEGNLSISKAKAFWVLMTALASSPFSLRGMRLKFGPGNAG